MKPIHVRYRKGLVDSAGNEAHASTFIRERLIVLDEELLRDDREHLRVFLHELFHFTWVQLGNSKRLGWEQIMRAEWSVGVKGEAGWSAEWRKQKLTGHDVSDRSRKWREYCCESFCDTGAWVVGGGESELTLARRYRVKRLQWFIINVAVPTRRQLIPLVLPVVAAGALWFALGNHKAPGRAAVRDEKGRKTAPEFALKDASGKVVHLSDYRGKVVLLDFWATWCGPCNLEIPWFTDFERKYKDRGFEVLGVSMDDEGWKAINPFVLSKKINYRIVLGDDKTGDQYGGIEALPTTFVLDREGRIASVHIGLSGREEFENAIEKLLQDPVDDVRGKSRRPNES